MARQLYGQLATWQVSLFAFAIQYSLSLLPPGFWQLTYLVFPFFVLPEYVKPHVFRQVNFERFEF